MTGTLDVIRSHQQLRKETSDGMRDEECVNPLGL